MITRLPERRILIKSHHLLPGILDILPRFHPHVEDRTISTRANDFTVNTALAPLALRPKS